MSTLPDALPLEPEERGDDGVLQEMAVLLRLRHVPQHAGLGQRKLLPSALLEPIFVVAVHQILLRFLKYSNDYLP